MTGTNETGREALERLIANVPDADVDAPDWGNCFQSWRGYFPKELRPHWANLPREARLIAIILGDELVSRERVE
jgi:hypothetical protein